jgi:extracellular matrix protein 14
MKLIQCVSLALLALVVSGFQIPLLSDISRAVQHILNNQQPKTTYKDIDKAMWALDFTQYEGDKIVRMPMNDETKPFVLEMRKTYDQWEGNNDFVDFRVPEGDLHLLETFGYEVIINDLAQAVFETFPNVTSEFNIQENQDLEVMADLFFRDYRPLNTIYSWLDFMKETFPDLVEIEWLGQTFEGRDMKALHLSSKKGLNPDKKTIVLTAGVHAREWISTSTALFTIFKLLTEYGKSRKETEYLDKLDFLIVPVFNPDGYAYTWSQDRLWRKNRQETYIPRCFGIDIDHSFDYHWRSSEDYPCGEAYSGETQFEAIEAENLNTYINITKNDHVIYGFLDLHSYTQKILCPYAYSCDEQPRDIENLLELAYGISKSIRLKTGKHYEVLAACKDRGVDLIPGLGAGSALDYMYHNRAHWAFQLKLRDTGSHGFLLPADFIAPVGREIYAAVKYFCEFILNPDL